jgi:glutamine cyclotransferase
LAGGCFRAGAWDSRGEQPPFRKNPLRLPVLISVGLVLGLQCAAAADSVCPAPRPMHFVVQGRFPRDVEGFTEGFEVHDHQIYESTGSIDGGSRLMRMTLKGPKTGHVTVLQDYGQGFFGEGLTILRGQIFQLTWKDHQVFVYDLAGKRLRTMANSHEGWGLTNDGTNLIFDDGGASLYFTDPKDFTILHSVNVRRGAEPVLNINELEYVNGKIYANVFTERDILRINPVSGCVEAEAHLDNLWAQMSQAEAAYTMMDPNFVLNGIAYDPAGKLFYLTGKEWPMVFTGHFVDN